MWVNNFRTDVNKWGYPEMWRKTKELGHKHRNYNVMHWKNTALENLPSERL